MRHQRWIVLSFIGAAAVVGAVVLSASTSLFVLSSFPDQRLGPITSTQALSIVAAVVTFIALIRNSRAVTFTDEVVDELSKVTWPSKDETLRATTTVVVTTLLVAALLGAYDFLWGNLMGLSMWKQVANFIL